MEGYSEESASSTKKEGEEKPKKKETTFGLGKSTFEFVNKKDKAEKIAEAPVWERLIPKDGGLGPKPEASHEPKESISAELAESKAETDLAETGAAETAEDSSEASIEHLTEGEQAEVRKQIAREESMQLKAERSADKGPDEAAGREAAIEHLDSIAESSESTSLEPTESFAAVTAVGGEALTAAESEGDESMEGMTNEAPEAEPAALHAPTEFSHGEEIVFNAPEQAAEVADESEDDATQAIVNTSSRQTPAMSVVPGIANNGGNQPPTNPGATIGNGPNIPNGPGTTHFNTAPLPPISPNVAPGTTNVEYVRDTRSEGAYFLAGGILGYMLGRRRGRIKTEKRLKTVSQKLEKQIGTIRQEVVEQATVIREQARENYNRSHEPVQSPRAAESIDVRGEATNRTPEITAKPGAEVAATAERVRTMDHREVLAMAEKVVIDGTSLRTIYEAKQITEPGLRRITSEYLNGGDLRAALKREVEVKEMQYERDPQMRDRLAASYADVDAAQPQASQVSKEAMQAHAANPSSSSNQSSKAEAEAKATKERAKQVFVATWAVFIVVLVITAVILGSR